MVDSEEKENHRRLFNTAAFTNIDDEDTQARRGEGMTTARYNLIKEFLEECHDVNKFKEWKKSKRLNRLYELKKLYVLDEGVLYYQYEKGSSKYSRMKRKIAIWNQVFDIIYSQHFGSSNHRSYSVVHNALKETWHNITEKQCRLFQDYCKYCCLTEPKKKKHRGANKPIRSQSYRDRFQMDLIDFLKPACYDFEDDLENRRLYKYVLVIRDHFSRLVIIRPLQSKSAKAVAFELSWTCNLVGFPLILQTDNGGEVKGEDVLLELINISPYSHAIQGRVRTPRDQGLVERANRMIKGMIIKAVAVMKENGVTNANWVSAIPRVMAGCNSGHNKGKNELSPYRVVFGMNYDHPVIAQNVANFIVGETINDRIQRVGGKYKETIVSIEEETNDNSDQSLNSVFVSMEEELDRTSFNENAKRLITKESATFFAPTQERKSNDCDSPKSSCAETSLCLSPHETGMDVGTHVHPDLLDPALIEEMMNGDVQCHPQLVCPNCCIGGQQIISLLPSKLLRKEYVEDETSWWSWDYIMTYLILIRHVYEKDLKHTKVLVFDAGEYDHHLQTECHALRDENILKVISIAFIQNHFVVLIFHAKALHMEISDGLRLNTTTWNSHVHKLCSLFGLQVRELKHISPEEEDFHMNKYDEVTITVSPNPIINQVDGHNCGPIACAVIHDIIADELACDDPYFTLLQNKADDMHFVRDFIVRHYEHMIRESKGSFTNDTLDAPTQVVMTEDNTILCDPIPSPAVKHAPSLQEEENELLAEASYQITRDEERFHSNITINQRQETFANKTKKMFTRHMNKSNVQVGDYVRIKVDRRDKYTSNSTALLALVFNVFDNTKAINVVSPFGVLTTSGGKIRNIPIEEFSTVSEGVFDTSDFNPLKRELDEKTFVLESHEKRTMREMHEYQVKLYMNAEDIKARIDLSKEKISERQNKTKKMKGCQCKNGNCTRRCGCLKRNMSCHSKCACLGNCSNNNK
jgi:hypothetical protein